MGLSLGASAPIPRQNGKPVPRAALFKSIVKAAEDACDDPFLARFLSSSEREHELALVLHPGAEAVFFTWDPAGTITASAKTSTTGPGYHAYATSVLAAIGQRCALKWDWSDDETEYATARDFTDLQRRMADLLGFMGKTFLKHSDPEAGTLLVTLDPSAPMAIDGPFTMTPLGPRDRAWWQRLARGEHAEPAARDFYVWWTRDRDAAYFRKLGLMFMWSEVRWRPPENEEEAQLAQLALECFDRALELDPATPVPQPEIDELRALLALTSNDRAPEPVRGRIGYYRRVASRKLPGDWTIALPAYWYESFEEDTGTLSLGFNERAVHITTYEITLKRGQPRPTPDDVAGDFDGEIPDGATHLEFRESDLVRRGWIAPITEQGHEGMILCGNIGTPRGRAAITIWFESPAHRDWAMHTFKSVTPPQPTPKS